MARHSHHGMPDGTRLDRQVYDSYKSRDSLRFWRHQTHGISSASGFWTISAGLNVKALLGQSIELVRVRWSRIIKAEARRSII